MYGHPVPYATNMRNIQNRQVLKTVQHCEAVCEFTEYYVLTREDPSRRKEQLRMLRDCADICTLTAKYMARHSRFAKSLALLCAKICEVCGNHCSQQPDQQSQTCGQTCLQCARDFIAFSKKYVEYL